MIIPHAVFVVRRFFLWGEAPAGTEATAQPKRRGKKAKNPPAAGLPFAAGSAGLSVALTKSLGRFPFWSGADSFPECLALHYAQISQEVTKRLFGE